MIILGIILLILGFILATWTYKNTLRSRADRPFIFNTELGGCVVNVLPLILIVTGIYILMTS